MITRSLTLLALASFSMPGWADITSLVGQLATPDDVYTYSFNLTSLSGVTIQTWGYSGGTNASLASLPAGGFDPAVALFFGTGPSATLFDFDDDGTCPPGNFDPISGACLDASLIEPSLQVGTYMLVLMASPNFPIGPTFADGFAGGGDFTDVFGNSRTNNFAVDIVTTPFNVSTAEPPGLWLVASALLCLVQPLRFCRKRPQMSVERGSAGLH